MKEVKEYKQLGAYAIVVKDEKILLIKKYGGPYDGKLDLPGGTIEFGEKPEEALKRELLEEVGIEINSYKLFDANATSFDWDYKEKLIKVHHVGIFYMIESYSNQIRTNVKVDAINDDSMGAEWFDIASLKRSELSNIAIMELEKMEYKI